MAKSIPRVDFGYTPIQPVQTDLAGGTALVIIDMQYHDASPDQGFNLATEVIQPGSMAYFNERNESLTIPTIRQLLEYFRARHLPVVHVIVGTDRQDYGDLPERMQGWVRELEQRSGVRDLLWSGNPAFQIREELTPAPGEIVITKRSSGAFSSTNIDAILRSAGIRNLIITGVSTNMCVESTARAAADLGYGCVMVDEGMADYDAQAHEASLRAFYFNFGRVAPSAEAVIAAMNARASI
jgi:nicotinamidase-related amidase